MKVETLEQFRAFAEDLLRKNPNARYSMKYRDDEQIVSLKVTDDDKTYTIDINNHKYLRSVTELNMRLLSLMSGRTKLE
ncbi:hypothetical protein EIN_296850 [Entamoeba invadens IP1]|uniref:Signal recognition particle 9 kDa protein n=1 Tax=Entamoeba invadens IP1 TaxID=370355 RepID=L7FKZ2_ENTIV|nr:hypothetical protein EIN_296850 [Entamoeba invadens IP1]ELP86365.1 hypothetical protein EIN_296850 [Entamoeba invadens IP1]|eukprot:XP_004185711.1 hypothetical protein EIN_296850 [Entamoeba invadens IP1]